MNNNTRKLTDEDVEELRLFLNIHKNVQIQVHSVNGIGTRVIFYEVNDKGEPFPGMDCTYFVMEK